MERDEDESGERLDFIYTVPHARNRSACFARRERELYCAYLNATVLASISKRNNEVALYGLSREQAD